MSGFSVAAELLVTL